MNHLITKVTDAEAKTRAIIAEALDTLEALPCECDPSPPEPPFTCARCKGLMSLCVTVAKADGVSFAVWLDLEDIIYNTRKRHGLTEERSA